jgi:hypothetical protein
MVGKTVPHNNVWQSLEPENGHPGAMSDGEEESWLTSASTIPDRHAGFSQENEILSYHAMTTVP